MSPLRGFLLAYNGCNVETLHATSVHATSQVLISSHPQYPSQITHFYCRHSLKNDIFVIIDNFSPKLFLNMLKQTFKNIDDVSHKDAGCKNEIILYRPNELAEHINNVFSEGELLKEVVVANFATTTQQDSIKEKTQANIVYE